MFARVALCVVATASFVAASSDQMAPWLAGEAITLAQSQQCKTFNADGTCQTSNDVPTGATAIPYTAGSYNGKDDLIMFEAFEGQNNCFVTSKKPRQPRSLSFCHKFNDESCCAPQMDAEITETFNFLTGTGLSCRIRGDIREDPLAQWFCMGCDPEQPKYVRPVPHDVITPDCAVVDDDEGGCGTSPSGDRGTTALMCRDWARTSFGVDPILAGPNNRFDLCGLLKSTPCLDGAGTEIPGRDPYTCGDDLVIPSNHVVSVTDSGVTENGVPSIVGAVDVDASIEAFLNLDTMGPPGLNEDYFFKLVDEKDCDEDILISLYKALDTDAGELPNPNCVRNLAQLTETTYFFGEGSERTYQDYFCEASAEETCATADCTTADGFLGSPCCCGTWHGEACFDSAHGLSPLSLISMLVASVAAFMML